MRKFVKLVVSAVAIPVMMVTALAAAGADLPDVLPGQEDALPYYQVPDVPVLTVRANPGFSPDTLPPDARAQYDLLWQAINSPEVYPNADRGLADGALYQIGRTADQRITALSLALRATGDPALVEEIWRLAEIGRGSLADTNNDSYLNWTYQFRCDTDPTYLCGNDTILLEETLTFGAVAHWTYVLNVNRDLDPRYAEAADFWTQWLMNDLRKWALRGGLDRSLTHAYSGVMRGHYYLYRVTGELPFLYEAQRRAKVLLSMQEDSGAGWVFDHRVPGFPEDPYGPHPTTYALHTFGMWADLALDGFTVFASDEAMTRWAATLRDNVLAGATLDGSNGTLANDIAGRGTDQFSKFAINNAAALALWDPTGAIKEWADRAWGKFDAHDPRRPNIPAVLTLYYVLQDGSGVAARLGKPVPVLNLDNLQPLPAAFQPVDTQASEPQTDDPPPSDP